MVGMEFGGALDVMREGGRTRRSAWAEGHLELATPELCPSDARLYLHQPKKKPAFWVPTQNDILASDWETT